MVVIVYIAELTYRHMDVGGRLPGFQRTMPRRHLLVAFKLRQSILADRLKFFIQLSALGLRTSGAVSNVTGIVSAM
jgi:hypothetical protein